ncbi:YhjD/YihY/BrkB family envelope integrity protein [Melissospora conviva]|uniref:YhjD/YihY/BrkB family envelope integrity protein n=1 Tax=Melissospora conviva TaxID=3388432 RepID=UPI003C1DBE54
MNIFGRIEAAVNGVLAAARRRSKAYSHLADAIVHYNDLLAGRLAAAIAYYGFFAVFALALVGYWVFGAILGGNSQASAAAGRFLNQNLPFLNTQQIQESSGRVGIVGLIILVLTGIRWVDTIRSSQRALYDLPQQPGNTLIRRLLDLGVLLLVFALLAVSVAAVDALRSLLEWLLSSTGSVGLSIISWVLSLLVNMVLAAALLTLVPRVRLSRRRLRPALLTVAVGITVLNTVGRFYVVSTERNPAYTVVGTAVGLLVYLYLLNQLLLFGAALAATSRHGRIADLTDRSPAGRAATQQTSED